MLPASSLLFIKLKAALIVDYSSSQQSRAEQKQVGLTPSVPRPGAAKVALQRGAGLSTGTEGLMGQELDFLQ